MRGGTVLDELSVLTWDEQRRGPIDLRPAPGEERPPQPVLAVGLLGGFSLRADGRPLPTPVGRHAQLLRLLAGLGPLHLEQATEELWAEASPDAGRARLRNVLARLRACCGPVVVREGDVIALADGVEVDAAWFEAAVRRALAAPRGDPSGPAWARRALDVYSGPFLPEDPYSEWTQPVRERIHRHLLDALDLLACDAAERGRVRESARLYERGIEIEPYDEERYVAAAGLLLANGYTSRAMGLLGRANAVAAELGVRPSPALRALDATLRAS